MIITDKDSTHTSYSIEKWLCFWLVKVNGWPKLFLRQARALAYMQWKMIGK